MALLGFWMGVAQITRKYMLAALATRCFHNSFHSRGFWAELAVQLGN
jgi:hypothetical protein